MPLAGSCSVPVIGRTGLTLLFLALGKLGQSQMAAGDTTACSTPAETQAAFAPCAPGPLGGSADGAQRRVQAEIRRVQTAALALSWRETAFGAVHLFAGRKPALFCLFALFRT